MSGVRVGGSWKIPSQTFVKVGGSWKTAATVSVKVGGAWKTTTFSGPPDAPTLSYTAQGQFTITNYDSNLFYNVSGATRSGNLLSSVSNGATITASYASGAPASSAATMLVANHVRILTSFATGVTSTGCGPRPNLCCPGGTIMNTSGQTCGGAPGSLAPDQFCGGGLPGDCPGNCFQLTISCYNWRWTNYDTGPDGTGYTLIGSIWGKVA